MKKTICMIGVALLLVSAVPINAFAATVIGEDVSIETPVRASMETAAEAQTVDAQLTNDDSYAVLCDDAAEGEFSLKVKTTDETSNPYAEYTLVYSDSFYVDTYGSITLWVKAGAGASWISFYTDGVLITCDRDGDGKFEVGSDLQSGTWTQLTLDLFETETPITEGDDLAVRSDEYSVWYFDGVECQGTQNTEIDLSTMVNDDTEYSGGSLRFKKSSIGSSYDTNPTVLVSNREIGFEKEFTTYSDFAGGSYFNTTISQPGQIIYAVTSYSYLCSGGTAISGGYTSGYPETNAFDGSNSTFWHSSQSGSDLVGNAYIGYDFGAPKTISGFYIYYSIGAVTSVFLQYYDEGAAGWVTVGTYGIPSCEALLMWITSDISAARWRLLAANYSGSTTWNVARVDFLTNQWSYTSAVIDISTAESISQGTASCSASANAGVTVETALSLDGGGTWSDWAGLNRDGTISGIDTGMDFQNARLKYRLSGRKATDADAPAVDSVHLALYRNELPANSLSGRINRITIENQVIDAAGNSAPVFDSTQLDNSLFPSQCALSGNGKVLYYLDNIDGYLYSMDMATGECSLLTNAISSIQSFQVNYDGTVLCILGTYDGTMKLLKCTAPSAGISVLASNDVTSSLPYDIGDDGRVLYYHHEPGNYDYITSSVAGSYNVSSFIPQLLAISDTSSNFFAVRSSVIYFCGTTDFRTYSTLTPIHSASAAISSILTNSEGKEVYYLAGGSVYSYNVSTETLRLINIGIDPAALIKTLDDGRILIKDTASKYFLYDPATGARESISPSALSSPVSIDDAGNTIVYRGSSGMKAQYLHAEDKVNKYLLSSDRENTWYGYQNGTWLVASNDKTPDAAAFSDYGMTADEVNALTADDFAPLYENGNEIYTADVAIYFNSVNFHYSPSVSAIKILTDVDRYGSADGSTANPLYAAKKEDFSASGWRKISRIYPVEICGKAADYLYFFYAGGKYGYYDGSAWQMETGTEIADLIADVGANWTSLRLIGMTAQEVRAIPQGALTAQLAGTDFSVVYCMRVPDTSTAGYYSIISADYSEELFGGGTLTLTITYSNGTSEQIAGMTGTQIEDFMEWLLKRTSRSSTYYFFAVGSVNYFINYYMVSNVSVTES